MNMKLPNILGGKNFKINADVLESEIHLLLNKDAMKKDITVLIIAS